MKLSIYRRKDLEKSGIRAIRKKVEKNVKKVLTFSLRSYIITLASRIERTKQSFSRGEKHWRLSFGVWLSLARALVWDQEVAGSNPVTRLHAGVVQW